MEYSAFGIRCFYVCVGSRLCQDNNRSRKRLDMQPRAVHLGLVVGKRASDGFVLSFL